MTAITFETHQAVRRLEAAGADRDELATKTDPDGLEARAPACP